MTFFASQICALFLLIAITSTFGYHHEEHHDHHPSYKFEYGVKDPKTHDHKSAWEHRDGHDTKGMK